MIALGLMKNPVYCYVISTSTFKSILTYGEPVCLTSQSRVDAIMNEVVYLTSIDKQSGEKETHVFDNTNGETLTEDYLYFVKVVDLKGNVTVEETRIYGANDWPHTTVYGMCDSKCKVQVPTKEEYEEFKERFAVLDYTINEVIGANDVCWTSHQVSLPDGFTVDNCCILSTNIVENDSSKSVANEMIYSMSGKKLTPITLRSIINSLSVIQINLYNPLSYAYTFNYTIRYVLYRYK